MPEKKEIIPKKPWSGAQLLELRLRIPCDVVMMCNLMDIKPEHLLRDFLSCLAVENNERNPAKAKQACIDFFISYGYGSEYYSEEERRQMFTELQRINDLWFEEVPSKFIDLHANWRRKYWKQWFKKWYWKVRRKKVSEE
jgi:hypothetical protein